MQYEEIENYCKFFLSRIVFLIIFTISKLLDGNEVDLT